MEWQGSPKNPAQLKPLSLETNPYSVPHLPEDDLYQPLTLASGSNGAYPVGLPLPQWIQYPQTLYDEIKFLDDRLAFPLLESVQLPLGDEHPPNGIAEIQRDVFYNNSVKTAVLNPAYFSHDMDDWKARFLKPHTEGEPIDEFRSTVPQVYGQNRSLWTGNRNKDNCYDSLPHSRVKVSASRYLSKNKSSHRQRASSNDRRRRKRIEKGLAALCQLLPHPMGNNKKASQLDDLIDHIKLLQLHIKELSRSKLADQSTSDPFVFVEGYGHYLLHDHMPQEPLEEMMAKLLEDDPSSAALLLESRGLSMMPLDLAEGLLQAG